MQAAAPRDQIVAGPQIEMIGVAQQDLGAERLELAVRDALHRALRADRHERRRLDARRARSSYGRACAKPSVCVQLETRTLLASRIPITIRCEALNPTREDTKDTKGTTVRLHLWSDTFVSFGVLCV